MKNLILEYLERKWSANSKKHSDLYTDENPKDTIHGLDKERCCNCRVSVKKIENSGSHMHIRYKCCCNGTKTREMGKTSEKLCIENT